MMESLKPNYSAGNVPVKRRTFDLIAAQYLGTMAGLGTYGEGQRELPPSQPSKVYHPPVDYNRPCAKSRGKRKRMANRNNRTEK